MVNALSITELGVTSALTMFPPPSEAKATISLRQTTILRRKWETKFQAERKELNPQKSSRRPLKPGDKGGEKTGGRWALTSTLRDLRTRQKKDSTIDSLRRFYLYHRKEETFFKKNHWEESIHYNPGHELNVT